MPADPFDLAARFAPVPEPADRDGRVASEDRAETAADEAAYVCDGCGEQIVAPVDLAAGREQEYVEDCPVCCRPNVLRVTLSPDGAASCTARPE